MVKTLRQIAREWGRSHALLDAFGIGKHGATLPERVQQLLRQLVGGAKVKAEAAPEGVVRFDPDPKEKKRAERTKRRKKRK